MAFLGWGAAELAALIPNDPIQAAVDDFFTVGPDRALSVGAPGVLANDRARLPAQLAFAPRHAASFQLRPDGGFTYRPRPGWTGRDRFGYYGDNGASRTNVAVVTLEAEENDPPVADGDEYAIEKGETLIATSLLDNDTDDDGPEELTAVRVSEPSKGVLDWWNEEEGTFQYTPHLDSVREDSFTYKAYDGMDYSEVVTVTIRINGIDLRIHDGQGGAAVPEDEEETVGAFTVVNWNDTDGDGRIDRDDTNGVTANPKGQDEVDLMRLVISKPEPDNGGEATLRANSDGVVLWKESTKVNRIQWEEYPYLEVHFATEDIPPEGEEIWVELVYRSQTPRDFELTLEYDTGEGELSDEVRATSAWVELEAVEHDTESVWDLFQQSTWEHLNQPENDDQRIAREGLVAHLGTGLRRLSGGGGRNVILFKYVVGSPGIVNETRVKFDATRRVDRMAWEVDSNGVITKATPEDPTLPEQLDSENDDAHNTAEYDEPNQYGEMFEYDAPGRAGRPGPNDGLWVYRGNFDEFVRVGIGRDVDGNGLAGSRGSEKYLWHACHRLENVNGDWRRTTGDGQEVHGVNCIGPGHITIGDVP